MRRSLFLALIATVAIPAAPQPADAAPNIVIFSEDFETGDLSRWDNVHTDRYAVTSDPARVKDGTYALEGTIPEGPGWGEINKWFMPGYDEIYVLRCGVRRCRRRR